MAAEMDGGSSGVLNPERLNNPDMVGIENGKVYVLARGTGPNNNRFYSITHDAITGKVLEEDSFKEISNMIGSVTNDDITSALIFAFTLGLVPFIYETRPSVRERRKKTKEYNYSVEYFEYKNLEDLWKRVNHIRLYQGDIKTVEDELGPLERVETGTPETFIETKYRLISKGFIFDSPFWLRVKTLELGADAIVSYQPGSSIGTPVRKIKK